MSYLIWVCFMSKRYIIIFSMHCDNICELVNLSMLYVKKGTILCNLSTIIFHYPIIFPTIYFFLYTICNFRNMFYIKYISNTYLFYIHHYCFYNIHLYSVWIIINPSMFYNNIFKWSDYCFTTYINIMYELLLI